MSALDVLLSVPVLMNMVDRFPGLTKPGPFQQLFMKGDLVEADGDRAVFKRYTNDRRLAGVRTPSSQAHQETSPSQDVIDIGFVHCAVKETLTPQMLYSTAGPALIMRDNAEDVVARTAKRLMSRLLRTSEYVCARVLQDASGVTISPSAAAWIGGANEVTSTVTIPGGLQSLAMAAKWDIETTRMFSDTSGNQLPAAHNTFEANGHRAYHAIMNRFVAAALQGNIEAQTFLVNQGVTPQILERALRSGATMQGEDGDLSGSVFNGLGNIPLWHSFDHGYENGAGTFTRYMDSDKVILLPEALDEVLGFAEGPVYIPNMQQVIGAEQADELFSRRTGPQLYAYRTVDDVGSIVLVARYSFIPVVKNNLGALRLTGVR